MGRGGGGEGGGDVKRAEVVGWGEGRFWDSCLLCRRLEPDFVGVGSHLLVSHLHGDICSCWPLEMYINEDGVGLEGTLCKYPHGNESLCSSEGKTSGFALGRLCQF